MSGRNAKYVLGMAGLACVLGLTMPAAGQLGRSTGNLKEAIEGSFTRVVVEASRSTVLVRIRETRDAWRPVALGTIVGADGYILTKASEVREHPEIYVAVNRNGVKDYPARVVGWSEPQDLAMLKIELTGLKPVTFADTRPPPAVPPVGGPMAGSTGRAGVGTRGGRGAGGGGFGMGGRGRFGGPIPVAADPPAPPEGAVAVPLGAWVATVDAGATIGSQVPPRGVGIISAARRRIQGRFGFLGVMMASAAEAPDAPGLARGGAGRGAGGGGDGRGPGGTAGGVNANRGGAPAVPGVLITQVVPNTAAARAGVQVDDIITQINGRPVRVAADLTGIVQSMRAGDGITLTVVRGEQTLTLRALLGDPSLDAPGREDQALLAGEVSRRASDFPAVLQHDTVLRPNECGGPLVDLEGRVVGINIARAGRTESYAIPADLITPLLEPMMAGRMPPPTATAPVGR